MSLQPGEPELPNSIPISQRKALPSPGRTLKLKLQLPGKDNALLVRGLSDFNQKSQDNPNPTRKPVAEAKKKFWNGTSDPESKEKFLRILDSGLDEWQQGEIQRHLEPMSQPSAVKTTLHEQQLELISTMIAAEKHIGAIVVNDMARWESSYRFIINLCEQAK